jgi:hypothetical protein
MSTKECYKEAEIYTKEYLNNILNKSVFEYYLIEKYNEHLIIDKQIDLFKNTKIKDILVKIDTNNNFDVYKDDKNLNQFQKTEQFKPLIIEKVINNSNDLRKSMLIAATKYHIENILSSFCGSKGKKILYEININQLKQIKINEALKYQINNLSQTLNSRNKLIEDLTFDNHNFRIQIEKLQKKIDHNNEQENKIKDLISQFKSYTTTVNAKLSKLYLAISIISVIILFKQTII